MLPCPPTLPKQYHPSQAIPPAAPAPPPQQPVIAPHAPDPAKLAVVQEQLKCIKAAAYTSDIDLLIAKDNEVLAAVEPSMASSQFAMNNSASAVQAASKRMRGQAMGSSMPAKKRQRTTANNTKHGTGYTGGVIYAVHFCTNSFFALVAGSGFFLLLT